MKFTFTAVVAFFVAATSVASQVATGNENAYFYPFDDCFGVPGTGHSIDSTTCLPERNPLSVLVPNNGLGDGPANQYSLTVTENDDACSCQTACFDFTPSGNRFERCHSLFDYQGQSYRFRKGACNLNTTCIPS